MDTRYKYHSTWMNYELFSQIRQIFGLPLICLYHYIQGRYALWEYVQASIEWLLKLKYQKQKARDENDFQGSLSQTTNSYRTKDPISKAVSLSSQKGKNIGSMAE